MKKYTEEERKAIENAKAEKAIKRELEYWDNHFGVKETVLDSNNKEKIIHYPANGKFTENGVAFTWDANNYIVMVNSHKEIKRKVGDSRKEITVGHAPFIKQYTRCKETSKLYYYRSKLDKATKSVNISIAEDIVTDMTIEQIIAKAHIAKGFAQATNDRLLQCIELANSKATTAYKSATKAKERANCNKTENKAKASA